MTNGMRVLACVMALCALGCGDDGTEGGSGGPDGGGAAGTSGGGGSNDDPVAQNVAADEGGTVETESGSASADIPAGALAEDTEITITVLDADDQPDADRIIAAVYDFGPDGTTFAEPVTLRIELDAGAVTDGMQPVMAWLDGDSWQPLADSVVQGNVVTASTDHFTPFTIILTAAGQSAGSCDELDFEPCGGDLVGSWEFSLGCGELPPDFLGTDGPLADCQGVTAELELDFSGSITFDEDGTYETDQMSQFDVVLSVPKSCLMNQPCSALGDDPPAIDVGDACEVVQSEMSTNVEEGDYEVTGNSFTTMSLDPTTQELDVSQPVEYCVTGDVLVAKVIGSDADTLIFQATRQ
jgi:hypothetical protein